MRFPLFSFGYIYFHRVFSFGSKKLNDCVERFWAVEASKAL